VVRDADLGMGEEELADARVQREAVDRAPFRVDEHVEGP
jgi:hypothetical protein